MDKVILIGHFDCDTCNAGEIYDGQVHIYFHIKDIYQRYEFCDFKCASWFFERIIEATMNSYDVDGITSKFKGEITILEHMGEMNENLERINSRSFKKHIFRTITKAYNYCYLRHRNG